MPKTRPKTPDPMRTLMTPILRRVAAMARMSMARPPRLKADQSSGRVSVFHRARRMKLRLATQMRATTAGRRPLRMPRIGPMSPYLRKTRAKIIPKKNDGVTKPRVAATAPPSPAILVPTKVAALMPIGPGVI